MLPSPNNQPLAFGGIVSDTAITISSDSARAKIALCGAELLSLTSADGIEVMWQGDKNVWSGTSPLLFPVIGTAAKRRIRYRGAPTSMPPHGFVGVKVFHILSRTDKSCHLRLCDDEASRALYPYNFMLDVRYEISTIGLEAKVTVSNLGYEPMPYSFGFHPGMNLPKCECFLTLEQNEGNEVLSVRRKADIPSRLPSPFDGRTLRLSKMLFQDGAFLFAPANSRAVKLHDHNGMGVSVAFSNLDYLAFWSIPGAPFVCVEPWNSLPANLIEDCDFDRSLEVPSLEPDTARTHSMSISWVGKMDMGRASAISRTGRTNNVEYP